MRALAIIGGILVGWLAGGFVFGLMFAFVTPAGQPKTNGTMLIQSVLILGACAVGGFYADYLYMKKKAKSVTA